MVQGRPYGLHIPRTLEAPPVANFQPDAVKRKAPPEPDSALISRVEPLAPAPLPRLHKLASPDTAPRRLRVSFLVKVVHGVPAIGQGQPLPHHPLAQVLARYGAPGDDAILSARAFAASFPHFQGLPSRRQSWRLSGASIPCRRTLRPCTSMVSPSITEATPATSARAGVASKHRARMGA